MPPKILSDSDKMGTMMLYLDGQEIRPCAELAEDLPEINLEAEDMPDEHPALPQELFAEIKLAPIHRSRWRMIKRAYKLTRTTPIIRVVENELYKRLADNGFISIEGQMDYKENSKLIKIISNLPKSYLKLEARIV